jgi:hypothetical protein
VVNVHVPEEFHRRLKHLTVDLDVYLVDLVIASLEAVLDGRVPGEVLERARELSAKRRERRGSGG